MLQFLSAIFVFVGLACIQAESSGRPGRVTFYSTNTATKIGQNTHITRDLRSHDVKRHLESCMNDYEAIFIFDMDSDGELSLNSIPEKFDGPMDKTVMPSIYNAGDAVKGASIKDSVYSSFSAEGVKKSSLKSVSGDLKSSNALENKKTDVYDIDVSSQSQESLDDFLVEFYAMFNESPILFMVIEEPSLSAPEKQGEYSRILSSSSSNKYLEPEGTEYSIYYADTYLYMTPDIFTGLMTGLFVAFVLLIGLNCLGAIQGMSSFVEKNPPVGKEA